MRRMTSMGILIQWGLGLGLEQELCNAVVLELPLPPTKHCTAASQLATLLITSHVNNH